MDQMPEAPVTLDEMIVRWAARDAEYAKARTPMSPDMAAAVRHMRLREVNTLPPEDRARAWAKANSWLPPEHQEFGSLKEWVE